MNDRDQASEQSAPLVDTSRLVEIENPSELFKELPFADRKQLVTNGDPLVVTDPGYLADVYNPSDDPIARYLWENGVFVLDFGGDTGGVLLWEDPHLLLPISMHREDDAFNAEGELVSAPNARPVSEAIGCDSGSFVFVVYGDDLPVEVRAIVDEVLDEKSGSLLHVPPGAYQFKYVQYDPVGTLTQKAFYRDICAIRDDNG